MKTGTHPDGAHEAAGELIAPSGIVNGSPAAALSGMRYMARQPIMDTHGKVHGYELLFRAGHEASFRGDPALATQSVLDQSAVHGLHTLANGRTAFVNCTRAAILEEQVRVLHPGQTVLELLETLAPDADLLAACLRLRADGYRFALDDFCWHEDWIPFLPLADYVKVDIEQSDVVARIALGGALRAHGCKARLIAERVETEEDFRQLRTEGYELFQGYFFARPAIVENRTIPTNRILHLDLLRALLEEPLDQNKLSDLVMRDPSMMLRLLRLVNSPIYGVRNEIHSIRMALQLVGDGVFRRMATMAVASGICDSQPTELLQMAFHRARMCERAAEPQRLDPTEQYLVGMLSLVPAMLHASAETVIDHLPLRPEVRYALVGAENKERATLNWIERYEHGEWARCDEIAANLGVPAEAMAEMYIESLQWARENMPLEAPTSK